jgi:hypothetical protein
MPVGPLHLPEVWLADMPPPTVAAAVDGWAGPGSLTPELVWLELETVPTPG